MMTFLKSCISLCITMVLFTTLMPAQSKKDSLFAEWNNRTLHDTVRLQSMHDIIWDLYLFTKPDSARYYTQQQYDYAKSVNNSFYMAQALHLKALTHYLTSDFNAALDLFNQAIELRKKINDLNGIASSLGNIGNIYSLQGDNSTALKYFNESMQVKQQLGDEKAVATLLNNIGSIHKVLGDYHNAIECYEKSINILERLGDKKGVANAYNNIGIIYDDHGDFAKAVELYSKSLYLREEINDKKGMAQSYNNIGILYREQGEVEKAIEFYSKSHALLSELGDRQSEISLLNNMGVIYNANGYPGCSGTEDECKKKGQQKAMEMYQLGLNISREIGDRMSESLCLNNLASMYVDRKDYEKAIALYSESLNIREELEDKTGESVTNTSLANVYFIMGRINEAIACADKGLRLAMELEAPLEIKNAAEQLYTIHKAGNNPDMALKMFELYVKQKEILQSENNQKEVLKQELKYSFDKQKALDDAEHEKTLAIEKSEKERQQYIKNVTFAGLGVVVLFLAFVFNRLQVTRKQKNIIEEQKQLVDTINEELNQTNEEILAQRDEIERQKLVVEDAHEQITDSIKYAKRIQEAILPSVEAIQQHLPESFVWYSPKQMVAGDFFWMEKVGTKVYIAAADCTGHGVPGAMVSVVCSNALTKAVLEDGIHEVGKILDRTREIVIAKLAKSSDIKDGMDISLACIDQKTNTLQWAGANNPLYLLRASATGDAENEKKAKNDHFSIEIIKGDREPIGYTDHRTPFTTHAFDLHRGDIIYLFTDGFADQFGGSEDKKMGYQRFRDKLLEIAHKDMPTQHQLLSRYFDEWKKDEDQVDDLCVIGIKVYA